MFSNPDIAVSPAIGMISRRINEQVPFTAIPTLYGETTFRSRFEAQCAFLLDTLGWKWEYEGFSLMLPNGVMYVSA